MNLDMIGQLLGDTRKEVGGPLPTAKEFPGQIPTPDGVQPGAGLLDPKKVVSTLGDVGAGAAVEPVVKASPLVGMASGLLGKIR